MAVQGTEQKARFLRVRVIDTTKPERPAVNIKVPVGLVRFGLKMARNYSPEMKEADVDWDAINAMVEEGALGEIVEVEDEAEHKTIEVWVE